MNNRNADPRPMPESTDKRIRVLEMIASDMKKDAKHFDGQIMTGRNVATYFGNHGAAIAALADVVRSILEEKNEG